MIYIVMGMHKSGTTLISRLLHSSGINMVRDEKIILDYDQGNHYERESTADINNKLLEGFMIKPFFSSKAKHYHSLSIPNDLPNNITPETERHILEVIDKLNGSYENFGFKDPRTCLTYHLWKTQIPEHKVIGIYRDYREIINHYHRHLINRYNVFRLYRLLYVWIYYNMCMIKHFKSNRQNKLLVKYEALMSNSTYEFKKLENFIGHEINDMRDFNKRRNRNRIKNKFLNASFPFLIKYLPAHPSEIYESLEKIYQNIV